MKLYKCVECERSFESDKAVCNNKFRNGTICDSDDVRELQEIHSTTNWAYVDRLFKEGQNSY